MEVFFMQITGKKGIGNILRIMLQIAFYGGIILLAILPFILQAFGTHLNASMFIIYPNGLVLLIIVRQFIKLFDSLKNNVPFSRENVTILRNTGKVALIESLLWLLDLLIKMILVKSYDILVILVVCFLSILFLGVSIALYVLAELFKEATQYKKENELTI